MASLWLVAVAALAALSTPEALVYDCLDGSRFTLTTSQTQAVVRFADREYRLQRKPSALAIKYASESATLYLDEDFAAFVADDRPLPGCFREEGKR